MFARIVGVLLALALLSGGALGRTCPPGGCATTAGPGAVDGAGVVAGAHLDADGSCADATRWARQLPVRGTRAAVAKVILAAAWHSPPGALAPLPARPLRGSVAAARPAPLRGTLIAQLTSLLL